MQNRDRQTVSCAMKYGLVCLTSSCDFANAGSRSLVASQMSFIVLHNVAGMRIGRVVYVLSQMNLTSYSAVTIAPAPLCHVRERAEKTLSRPRNGRKLADMMLWSSHVRNAGSEVSEHSDIGLTLCVMMC
jgi:energy-converting hydrogenase Eha subunit H